MDTTRIAQRIEEKYGSLGKTAATRLKTWLSGAIPYAFPEILQRHVEQERVELLFDAFWQVLPFGTGGRRGRVGYGANRFNPTTLAMTVQGHCNYLKRLHPDRASLAVAVANDVRVFNDISGTYGFLGPEHPLLGTSSRSLARLACQIYAANGITAYIIAPESTQATLTTPELSFVIGQNPEILGGANLSASHNPPDDSGIKIYDEFGSQPIAPFDQYLVDAMDAATDVRMIDFDAGLAEGLIRDLPADTHRKYVQGYVDMFGGRSVSDAVPITFTPLCGCGLDTVGDVLRALGFPVSVPPDQGPDGSFEPIPFRAPNPEVPQSTQPACQFAEQVGSTLVLSSDPDADRVGLEARLDDGTWYHFDGNQIAAILCYFLMIDPAGPRQKGLVIETLVTTKMMGKIVELAGDSALIDDLLVGFKYVADVLKRLGRGEGYRGITLRPDQLVLAAEESHGVIVDSRILDKDATPACMYLAWLHQRLVGEGRTLLDYYYSMIEELGGYDSVSRSIMMTGAEGMLRKNRIMASLRETPPEEFAGRKVTRVLDFLDTETFGPFLSETDKSPRDVVQFHTDQIVLTVRPSGTEPKLKLYCQCLPSPTTSGQSGAEIWRDARERANRAASQAYNALLGRIDQALTDVGLALPDVVDLNLKLAFDRETVAGLRQGLESQKFSQLSEVLGWLKTEAQMMTPGTDPLPALKDPLRVLCQTWQAEGFTPALATELSAWASS